MKIYAVEHEDGSVTTSNRPIVEASLVAQPFVINEEDLTEVVEGTKDWEVVKGKLKTKASTRKADSLKELKDVEKKGKERSALKAKMESGEASQEDIMKALSHIL